MNVKQSTVQRFGARRDWGTGWCNPTSSDLEDALGQCIHFWVWPHCSKLGSICTHPCQLCLTSESGYSLELTGQGVVNICLFGLAGSFSVASRQAIGLSSGVAGWNTMTCNMQEVSLGDLTVSFGLTLYEYSCKTNCLNPLPKRYWSSLVRLSISITVHTLKQLTFTHMVKHILCICLLL